MSQMTATIDGSTIQFHQGDTILSACHAAGVDLPTLCHGSTLTPANACRVCVVEVRGSRSLVPSCSRPLEEGMVVETQSDRARASRRLVLELLGSVNELDRTTDEVQGWIDSHDADLTRFGSPSVAEAKVDDDLYVRDYGRCILCYKCVDACGAQHQNTFAIAVAGRGIEARISTEFDVPLPESACVYCGNCIAVCPTGALEGKIAWDMREAGVWDESIQTVTRTVCSYCGVGCNLDIHTQEGRIVDVTSPLDHPVTVGNLCVKGRFGWTYVYGDPDG